jgi:GNAT superfamily N-acetyltransferase
MSLIKLVKLGSQQTNATALGDIDTEEYEIFLGLNSVGIVELEMDELHVRVFNIFIEEEYRGQGIASSLLTQLDRIVLAFNPVPAAVGFWQRHAHEIYY